MSEEREEPDPNAEKLKGNPAWLWLRYATIVILAVFSLISGTIFLKERVFESDPLEERLEEQDRRIEQEQVPAALEKLRECEKRLPTKTCVNRVFSVPGTGGKSPAAGPSE